MFININDDIVFLITTFNIPSDGKYSKKWIRQEKRKWPFLHETV